MKKLSALFLTVAIMTGCATIQETLEDVDFGPTGKVMVETFVRAIAYGVSTEFPVLAPAIIAATEYLTPAGRTPENFALLVEARFNNLDIKPEERIILQPLVTELARVYQDAYIAYGENPERDAELEKMFDTLVAVAREGVELGQSGGDASRPVWHATFSEIVLQVN